MNKNTKIHIVGGTGKMGNWLKNFLESQGLTSITVSGSKGVAKHVLENAELVFISVPISRAPAVIRESSKIIAPECLLVDLSSVMEESVKALEETNNPSLVLHFLFGPTVSSVENQNIVVSEVKESSLSKELIKIMDSAGGKVAHMDARDHDKKMALVQNLTHFVNLSLAKIFINEKIDLSGRLSTPVLLAQLAALSRVVSQDPNLLAEIQLNNPKGAEVIEAFINQMSDLLKKVKDKNKDNLLKELNIIHNAFESSEKKQTPNVKVISSTLSKKSSIAYLGPEGTFSHQAAKLLSKEGKQIPCGNFYEIFEKVKSGEADFGVVPSENSTEGTIRETLDYLIEFDLKTNGSLYLPVHQCLLSKEKNLKNIAKVISHPQGLAQCRNFLQERLPHVSVETSTSTVAAAANLTKGAAIIGPEIAASLYGLNLISKDIEDNSENVTRFFIISKKGIKMPSSQKTLIFLTVFNRVGVLRDLLEVIASFSINLSRIESRPSKEKIWDYCFFIEVDASLEDSKLSQALNMLKQLCPEMKVIGGV